MSTVRMLSTSNATQTISTGGGVRSYTPAPGIVFDVPREDVEHLAANGFFAVGIGGGRGSPEPAQVGATSARPTSAGVAVPLAAGAQYIDTTLGKIIIWDGATWRDYAGSAV
jgi:hypothetical protein